MTYNKALLKALEGKELLLPGWLGLFYWNYHTNLLEFKNGNYHLTKLDNFNLELRKDWYYII